MKKLLISGVFLLSVVAINASKNDLKHNTNTQRAAIGQYRQDTTYKPQDTTHKSDSTEKKPDSTRTAQR